MHFFCFGSLDSLLSRFFLTLQSLSRQSSLVEDRIDDSDEDDFLEERSGRCRPACSTARCDARYGYATDDSEQDTWSINQHRQRYANTSAMRHAFQHPDLLKDLMAVKLFKNSAERMLRRQQSDESRTSAAVTPKRVMTKQKSLDERPSTIGHGGNRGRSISRSLTSSDLCEMQLQFSELPKDKRGKRSRLIKSCIAQ